VGTIRSSVIGFVVGVLPGAGATIASAITYMVEKNLTDREGTFERATCAGGRAGGRNNAAAHGAFVPMLTLGVRPRQRDDRRDGGALTLYNITPGPLLFEQQPDLVWGLIASMFIGNVMLLVMNIPMIGIFARMLYVPNWLLVPAIAAVSFVGVYAVHATTFDLVLMVALGILAGGSGSSASRWRLSSWVFVLGDMMEQNLRRALAISDGHAGILFQSPVSITLWVLAAAALSMPSCCAGSSRRASGLRVGLSFRARKPG